jgi:hypothetical protein
MMEKSLLVNYEETDETVIEEALRTAPLAAPPPLLYAAVMQRVRHAQAPAALPAFRVTWLDLALSLFFTGMLAVVWFALQAVPQAWVIYWRNQALWSLQKVLYLDTGPLTWLIAGLTLAALAAGITAALSANTLKISQNH